MAIHIGSWGLPDFGVTEYLQNKYTPWQNSTPQGGSNIVGPSPSSVLGSNTYQAPQSYNNQSYNTQPNPTSQPVGGGGGGGGNPAQSNNDNGNNGAPMEQAPAGPDFSEIDNAIGQANQALDQYQSTLQPSYDTAVNEYTNTTNQQKQGALQDQQSRLNQYGQQATTATREGESAISQARRMAAELQQGIQARYGGTTGTGAFSSEILGREAMGNVQQNRAVLDETIGKITSAEEEVKNKTTSYLRQLDDNLTTLKEQARNQLQQGLAEIASKRAALQTDRATMRMDLIQNYQSVLSEINARNTQFKQQLYMKAQQASQQLEAAKAQTIQQFQTAFKPMETTLGNAGYTAAPQVDQYGSVKGVQYLKNEKADETGLENPFE